MFSSEAVKCLRPNASIDWLPHQNKAVRIHVNSASTVQCRYSIAAYKAVRGARCRRRSSGAIAEFSPSPEEDMDSIKCVLVLCFRIVSIPQPYFGMDFGPFFGSNALPVVLKCR